MWSHCNPPNHGAFVLFLAMLECIDNSMYMFVILQILDQHQTKVTKFKVFLLLKIKLKLI